MQSDFSIHTREKKNGKFFYVRFRNNETGEYMNAQSVDMLALKLGTRKHITKRPEAYKICEEAQEAGLDGNTSDKDTLFVDYVKQFWDWDKSPYIKKELRKDPLAISKSYVMNVQGYFKNHAEKRLPANLKCSQVKLRHLERVQEEVLEDCSISTWNNVLKSMSVPIKELLRKHILIENPLMGLERYKERTMNPRGILTEPEITRLIQQMESDYKNGYTETITQRWKNGGEKVKEFHAYLDKRVYLATCLGTVTGMRAGEILGLQIDSIMIPRGQTEEPQAIITVSQSMSVRVGLKCTKGKRTRYVTVPEWLALELISLGESNPAKTGFIFYSPDTPETTVCENFIRDNFYKALARMGISESERKERNIVFHSLRHYSNTRTTEMLGQSEAMLRIGHQDTTTSERYFHTREEHLLETGCRLAGMIPAPELKLVVNE